MDAVIYHPVVGGALESLPGPGIYVIDVLSAVTDADQEMSPPGIPCPSDHQRLSIVDPIAHIFQTHVRSIVDGIYPPVIQDQVDAVVESVGTI